ncbi:hypothetical protein [Streptococcus cuniculi]|uniref:Uncharacterized protein n=1 Tax=Streptococcus cuniculi TaxID=1432788 RepID=A0A4Y9JAG7_9STRE|nr:hypothetical protein [Streptococcus cuniculi]MBF0778941.1 hypothetical protein [Streptococcus cuniculi]TFU97096.1 hypothetical protein E4T82_09445 [Streptococcus cuniculi]
MNSKLRKELKQGLLDEGTVREIAESLFQELEKDRQTEDLRTKRLKIGIPILLGLLLLMQLASALKTGSASPMTLLLVGALFVGILHAFRWLQTGYLILKENQKAN